MAAACDGNGRTFLEGHLESMVTELRDDAREALGQGRPSGTARWAYLGHEPDEHSAFIKLHPELKA
jgi:hypothetical protein